MIAVSEHKIIKGAKDYLKKYEATYLDYYTHFYLVDKTLTVENIGDKVKITLFCDNEKLINKIIYGEVKEVINFFENEFEKIFSKIENKFIGE